jgi:hypothetical protein
MAGSPKGWDLDRCRLMAWIVMVRTESLGSALSVIGLAKELIQLSHRIVPKR